MGQEHTLESCEGSAGESCVKDARDRSRNMKHCLVATVSDNSRSEAASHVGCYPVGGWAVPVFEL